MEESRQQIKKLIGTSVFGYFISPIFPDNIKLNRNWFNILLSFYSLIQSTLGSLTIVDFTLNQDVTVSLEI